MDKKLKIGRYSKGNVWKRMVYYYIGMYSWQVKKVVGNMSSFIPFFFCCYFSRKMEFQVFDNGDWRPTFFKKWAPLFKGRDTNAGHLPIRLGCNLVEYPFYFYYTTTTTTYFVLKILLLGKNYI